MACIWPFGRVTSYINGSFPSWPVRFRISLVAQSIVDLSQALATGSIVRESLASHRLMYISGGYGSEIINFSAILFAFGLYKLVGFGDG